MWASTPTEIRKSLQAMCHYVSGRLFFILLSGQNAEVLQQNHKADAN